MTLKILLALSVVLNVALAAALLKPSPQPATSAAKTEAATIAAPTGASPTNPAPKARTITQVVTNTLAQKFDWSSVESDDYKKYIANLRAIGCPEETIRDIITADVNKLYEAKRKELAGPKKKFEFWKPGALMGGAIDPERTEKERALNKEKRALLTQLLGTAPDPEDVKKLMKESEAAIAGVLTPEELLDYNLRFSMTANTMRMQLAGFEPTEQEFLDLFQRRKAYDDEYGGAFGGGLNLKGEEKAKQEAAKKALDDSIKAQLGEQRYADYKRGEDFAFQAMYRTADREGLGKQAAVKVYDMKQAAEDQAKKLRADTALTPAQRTAALRAIREETERAVKDVLGEKGYTSLERNNGAWWLRNLSPDAPAPTKQP